MARDAKKPYSHQAFHEAAERFRIASDPTRLFLLGAIDGGESIVGALAEAAGVTQPAVSHHLSLLRAAHFLEARRVGRGAVYSLTDLGRAFLAWAEKLDALPAPFPTPTARTPGG